MGLPDPHDPRLFTHFAKLNADGSVAAIVEIADTAVPSFDPSNDGQCYVEITALRKSAVNLFAVKIDPKTVAAAKADPIAARVSLETEFRKAFAAAVVDTLDAKVFGGDRE